ncbi:MAG: hypothetical protein KKD13_01395, partial [Candidatus Margulisbacteria bacterium]|nr:hypothetical protein [Candidatus Margulisiibacteriota bacterium]
MRALLLLFFLLFVEAAFASPRFFSEFDLGPSFVNYREQVLNYPDPSTGTIGRIDSVADTLTYALRGRLEMYWDQTFLGLGSNLPVFAAAARESWRFNDSLTQTNDLSYAITSVEFYGG